MSAFAPIASIPISSGPTNIYAPPAPIVVRPSGCFGYTTAGDVASRALKLILVEAADSGLEPDEYKDALDAMNGYMASLEAEGLRLGYARVCNVSDIVTIPDGALRGLISNLAIEMAPMYGGKVSTALIKQASEGLVAMRRLGCRVGQALYPDNLPMGSGNLMHGVCRQAPHAQMTIQGNRRATDIQVEGGAEKAQGFWTVGAFHGLTPDVSGRITNKGPRQTVTISADFTMVSEDNVFESIIGFTRNAQFVMFTTASLSPAPARVLINGSVDLEPGQYLDIVIADAYAISDITLTDGVVRAW